MEPLGGHVLQGTGRERLEAFRAAIGRAGLPLPPEYVRTCEPASFEEDAALLSNLEARALTPGAHITILARSESHDSHTHDGPRGRATLGLRPAALIRVLPGEADRALFHRPPTR